MKFLQSGLLKKGIFTLLILANILLLNGSENNNNVKSNPEPEKQLFQTEVDKMLEILIHSLYTHRDIFLRELISNASDAIDKIRFLYLTDPKNPKNKDDKPVDMDIRIWFDKKANTLTIRDGGIGMSKADMVSQLGTLGASGTSKFLDNVKKSKDMLDKADEGNDKSNLIGKFGVGFYSAFLVSDNVKVKSKHDDSDSQWIWESNGREYYKIYEDPEGNTLGRGTEITLELKKDAKKYVSSDKIKNIIEEYSEFISFPIFLGKTRTQKVKSDDDDESSEEKKSNDDNTDENSEDDDDKEKKKEDDSDKLSPDIFEERPGDKPDEVIVTKWECLNKNKPLWRQNPSTITDEQYKKFYKSLCKNDEQESLVYTHFNVEGDVNFQSLLYIPIKPVNVTYDANFENKNLRLYVRRVFITEDIKSLLPRYMNFIRGVVDSDDLPLNVSREQLQKNSMLGQIKKKLVRKIIKMISDLVKTEKEPVIKKNENDTDTSLYIQFWEEFGKNIRLGIMEDKPNQKRLLELLRYRSTFFSNTTYISFDDYISRMPEKQKNVLYVIGETIEKLKALPVVIDAMNRGVEVLLMTDNIDEYLVRDLTDYKDKHLMNLAKEGAWYETPTDRERKMEDNRKEKYSYLTKWYKDVLGETVFKVQLTKRKTTVPVLLTTPTWDHTANLARIVKGQPLAEKNDLEIVKVRKVLEVNPLHPMIDEISNGIKWYDGVKGKEKEIERIKDTAMLLFENAALQSGFEVNDPSIYAQRVLRMISKGLRVDIDAPLLEEDMSEYEVEEEETEPKEEETNEDENEEEDDDNEDEITENEDKKEPNSNEEL